MRRGFKAETERRSAAARRRLGVSDHVPFDPWAYAKVLGVVLFDINDLGLSAGAIKQLTIVDGDSWSAMTLQEGKSFAIVPNPSHAQTRQRVDLMHELAHIELEHVPARVDVSETGLLLLSDYSDEQEQEADWYAGAFLLPREGLVRLRGRAKTTSEIAEHFGVSKALCEWRLRMTGVDVQMRRALAR